MGVGYCRAEKRARALVEQIEDIGRQAHLVSIDVTSAESIDQAVRTFIQDALRIDAWVNAAGIVNSALMVRSEEAALRSQLDVNLLGPMLCARSVLPHMMVLRSGVIVNIGSVAGAASHSWPGGVRSIEGWARSAHPLTRGRIRKKRTYA